MPGASTLSAPTIERTSVDGWLRAPAPAERLAMVRILVRVYALLWMLGVLPGLLNLVGADPARWEPVGVLAPFDAPVAAGVVYAGLAMGFVSGLASAAGVQARVSGRAFALCFLATATYRSSWGQIFHTDDLVAIHLLVLAVVPAADAWSWDARPRRPPTEPHPRYGWPLRLITIVTVLTYVLAGWAKLRTSGLDWITGSVLRDQIAQDNLLKDLFGSTSSPIAGPLLSHAWLFPAMAAFAVAVELGAPVAMLGRRSRDVWTVSRGSSTSASWCS